MRVFYLTILLVINSTGANADELESFLRDITIAIRNGNESLLNELIQPRFTYQSCEGTVNKDMAVSYLKNLPSAEKVSFTVVPGSLSDSMVRVHLRQFALTSPGLNLSGSFFYLNRATGQLYMGFDRECVKIDFVGKPGVKLPELSSEEMKKRSEEFIQFLEKTIATKKKLEIRKLFRGEFIYKNCQRQFNADKMAESYAATPVISHLNLKSVENYGTAIRFTASYDAVEIEYYLNKKHFQLERGALLGCVEKNSILNQPDSLMKRLENVIATRDINRIKKFFSEDFEYTSCSAQFNQTEFLKGLAAIDLTTKVSIEIKEMTKKSTSYEVYVKLQGLTDKPIEVLVLHSTLPSSGIITAAKVQSCNIPLNQPMH